MGEDEETSAEPAADAEEESDSAEGFEERIAALEAERDELRTELAEAEERIEDLTDRLQRKAADFENYKKRQARRREELEAEAAEELVDRLLDVRDNLKRAIEGDADDIQSLREGVKLTLAELDKVLDAEDVSEIDPAPGAAVDPERHEVMMRVESDQPVDHIDGVYQSGYERAGKVLRPAKVTVSDGATDEEAADGSDAEGEQVSE